jgi:hypothetical protein
MNIRPEHLEAIRKFGYAEFKTYTLPFNYFLFDQNSKISGIPFCSRFYSRFSLRFYGHEDIKPRKPNEMREPKMQIWTRAKTRKGRERPHLVRLSAAQESVGSLPPFLRTACPRPCVGTKILQCNSHYNLHKKRRKRCVTSESTIKATEDHKSSSPFGRRSQAQSGQVHRVP